jgi:hypothetical protein
MKASRTRSNCSTIACPRPPSRSARLPSFSISISASSRRGFLQKRRDGFVIGVAAEFPGHKILPQYPSLDGAILFDPNEPVQRKG